MSVVFIVPVLLFGHMSSRPPQHCINVHREDDSLQPIRVNAKARYLCKNNPLCNN